MQKEFVDNVTKANKKAFDSAKEVTDLNTSTFETLLNKQLELANQLAEINAKQVKIIAGYKDAPSALEAQSGLMQEITEQAAGNTREAVELLNKTRAAYDKLFQKGLKDANDAVKQAQSSATA